jgi:regulator of cell morphogenesis and NO signaling
LANLARQIEDGHQADTGCPRGLTARLEAIHLAVLDHLAKEERVLFPMILEGHGSRSGGPVRVMELEHDEHLRHLAHIRDLTHNLTPPDHADDAWMELYRRLGTLEAEFIEHIRLENEVLFPRALNED